MKIAIAQINQKMGDFSYNEQKIIEYIIKARSKKADVVIFPELAVTGYPPEDLLLKKKFIKDNLESIKNLSKAIDGITALVGFVNEANGNIYNSAALIKDKKIAGIYDKMILPNYGVFDEKRYFKPGKKASVFNIAGVKAGINICEDIWQDGGPIKEQAKKGAKIIFILNASPYHMNKIIERERILIKAAKANKVFIVYSNLVGGQDELVFDGYSMVVGPNGKVIARGKCFEEDLLEAEIFFEKGAKATGSITELLNEEEEVYEALKMGLKDYVSKNGFKEVVMGLSGGIDSALVAAIAADALGKDKVHCVFLPSEFSSKDSKEDAEALAKNLGVDYSEIPIQEIYCLYLEVLGKFFAEKSPDITEENLQARIRGNIIMALSNKFGYLVLATGNKSEMSTGYATLYGDMAGGLEVIKDVPKMMVNKLSKYRNSISNVIPERILTKAPTAELRHNQKDSDSLPPYEILDPYLNFMLKRIWKKKRSSQKVLKALL